MRAYLSSAAGCSVLCYVLAQPLLQGGAAIALAQCACTNAECSSVLATIGTRIVTMLHQLCFALAV